MPIFCPQCGMQNDDAAQVCRQCLASLPAPGGPYQQAPPPPYQQQQQQQQYYSPPPYGGMVQGGYPADWKAMGAEKKVAAGLCAIFLGGFGVHKFVLGYKTEGIILLVVSLVTCFIGLGITSIIGIIEGIIYLTKSDEEFVKTYIQGKKAWF